MIIKQPLGVSGVQKETEVLAATAYETAKKLKLKTVLDMGCGTGYIAIFLATKGMNAEGCDINDKAVAVSNSNAGQSKTKAEFFQSNLFSVVKKKYDLIVFNAPLGDAGGSSSIEKLKSFVRRISWLRKIVSKIVFKTALKKRILLNSEFIGRAKEHLSNKGKLLLLVYETELEKLPKGTIIRNKGLPSGMAILLLS
jgi:predicted RNA methylase